jgi:hypothetical protein
MFPEADVTQKLGMYELDKKHRKILIGRANIVNRHAVHHTDTKPSHKGEEVEDV